MVKTRTQIARFQSDAEEPISKSKKPNKDQISPSSNLLTKSSKNCKSWHKTRHMKNFHGKTSFYSTPWSKQAKAKFCHFKKTAPTLLFIQLKHFCLCRSKSHLRAHLRFEPHYFSYTGFQFIALSYSSSQKYIGKNLSDFILFLKRSKRGQVCQI